MHEHDDLWGKGLQLAYFVIPEHAIAIQILQEALKKLEVQRSREHKRRYWRDKNLKGKIRRISREDGDALQWLIYLEAEAHEKQQEQAGQQTLNDMVVRYIKHLMQLTTSMSSLYVNIGLHRLVHDYSTPEVRRVYEWITGHHPGHSEYRKVKGALMERLEERFKDFVKVCTGDRRELRFEAFENQGDWKDLVDECLRTFIPWSTSQACPATAGDSANWAQLQNFLSAKAHRRTDQDTIETHRCHAFIDPVCYGQIAHNLGLDSPNDRLAVPKFFLSGNGGGGQRWPSLRGEFPALTEDERNRLREGLEAEATLREEISAKFVTIVAHGKEYARFELTHQQEQGFEIREGIKLLEIWAHDGARKVLLATHWVRYMQWQGIAPATASVDLGNGKELVLRIIPAAHEDGGALVRLTCRPISRFAALRESLSSAPRWIAGWPKYAFATLLLLAVGLAIGWVTGRTRSAHDLARQSANIESMGKELTTLEAARSSLQYRLQSMQKSPVFRLIPDTIAIRERGIKEPVVSISSGVALVTLELPILDQQQRVYRAVLTPFLEKREILTENFLAPEETDGRSVVKFALPASMVQSGSDYVLSVESIDKSGHLHEVLKFTFYLEKK